MSTHLDLELAHTYVCMYVRVRVVQVYPGTGSSTSTGRLIPKIRVVVFAVFNRYPYVCIYTRTYTYTYRYSKYPLILKKKHHCHLSHLLL